MERGKDLAVVLSIEVAQEIALGFGLGEVSSI